jgi:SHS2 domain-containing protein
MLPCRDPSLNESRSVLSTAWEHFAHGADIGVCGIGATPAEAFEQVALAMTAVVTAPATIEPKITVEVHCEAPELELLLVDWLNALIYESATRRLLFGRYEVLIDGTRLTGKASGEPMDPRRHALAVEVKGATYTALEVSRGPDGLWRAGCVLDV